MTRQLDELDIKIIGFLTRDGRASNRYIATNCGITEATVAARLRRLIDDGIVTISCVFDSKLSGYHAFAHLAVAVGGRSVTDVASEICRIDGVTGIARTFGSTDLMVTALATNVEALFDLTYQRIGGLRGIASLATYVEVECLRYRWGADPSPLRAFIPKFPNPELELDRVDYDILSLVIENGRQSNRELSRILGVSEGTIRLRLRRLERSGFLRIVAHTDAAVTGTAGALAFLAVSVTGTAMHQVRRWLMSRNEVMYASVGFGPHNVLAVLHAPERDNLVQLITEELRSYRGVENLEVWEVIEPLFHIYNWVRLGLDDVPASPRAGGRA